MLFEPHWRFTPENYFRRFVLRTQTGNREESQKSSSLKDGPEFSARRSGNLTIGDSRGRRLDVDLFPRVVGPHSESGVQVWKCRYPWKCTVLRIQTKNVMIISRQIPNLESKFQNVIDFDTIWFWLIFK